MEIRHAHSARELAAQLHRRWAGPRDDPFAFDLAVTPNPGFQRWLSQQLATADPHAGICAGVEFCSASQLWARLLPDDDPWHTENLTWLIHQLVLAHAEPELGHVHAHFTASQDSYTAARRIATQFSGYLHYALPMLEHWAHDEDVNLDGTPLVENAWQPVLWRSLIAVTGHDPLASRQRILDQLRHHGEPSLPHRVAIIAPSRLDPAIVEFYQALGAHHQVDLLLLNHTVRRLAAPAPSARTALLRSTLDRPAGHPLNLALGAVGDENAALAPAPTLTTIKSPDSLLGWLQSDLREDRTPQPRPFRAHDDSIRFHLSHGPARQVDVLRDVLADLYTQHSDLEPRDIAILTPNPALYAPLLDAAFVEGPRVSGHPAGQFRVQLAERTAAQANPLVDLLRTLLQFPDSRFEATAVLEFISREPVARRFSFDEDARQRLADLVSSVGVRWGLNAAQRAEYGLTDVIHNTWQTGLQRMLLGITMSEDDLVSVGTVLPVDDVDSSDVELIGAITELIGRLTRWLSTSHTSASVQDWVNRCRDLFNDLIALPPSDQWQLSHVLSQLTRLTGDRPGGDGHTITRRAFLDAVDSLFAELPARATFGNGNTLVTGLTALADVPHRVIILLGWDPADYPRTGHRSGDDLLAENPQIGTPSPAMADRHALLAAVMAAEERLIIICRGRSDSTNERVPLATPITELRAALDATASTSNGRRVCEAITSRHPLQPFGVEYFQPGNALHSIDIDAFRAAQAWQRALVHAQPQPAKYQLSALPPLPTAEPVSLSQLIDFYRHPARTLLRVRAGISLTEPSTRPDQIPIELDALERWQIGNRILRHLQSGADPERVERAEWLRGHLPPFELGRQVMGTAIADSRRTLAAVPLGGDVRHHDLHLSVHPEGMPETQLTGQVSTIDSTIWLVEYSSLQPRQKLSGWLQLLLLAAAEPGRWKVQIAAKGRRAAYASPDPGLARELLGRYLAIYALGMTRPLPAMPRLTAEWMSIRAAGRDPHDPFHQKGLYRCWDWESDASWGKFFSYPEILGLDRGTVLIPGADQAEKNLLGALASAIWTPINAAEVTP